MKKIVFVLLLASASFAQNDNYNGWLDTARFKNFYADTTMYSNPFNMTAFVYEWFAVYARDTSVAGFSSDSVSFEWGIQCGHPSWTTTYGQSKTYAWGPKVVLDTFYTLSAGNFAESRITKDSCAIPYFPVLLIDSSTVSGWAYQTSRIFGYYDVRFRFWAKGMAGNLKSKHLDVVFQAIRQNSHKVGF